MSDVVDCIDFLEILGADAALQSAAPSDLDRLLVDAGLDPALGAAIATGNGGMLGRLLEARDNVCCLVEPGKEEDEEEEEESEDEDEESEDEGAASQNRVLHPLADAA